MIFDHISDSNPGSGAARAEHARPCERADDPSLDVWHDEAVTLQIELEREADGRWIAEVTALPGALAYGDSREAAIAGVQALALRIIADRLEHGEEVPGAKDGVLRLDFAA